MEFYEAGNLPPTVDIHMRVASDNGVPAINVGQYLWEYIFKNGANIQDYLTDIVHPNDLGHQLYAEAIIEFLMPYFENNPTIPDGEKYHYSGDLANATLMDMSEMVTTTCNKVMNENEVTLLCTKGQAFSGSFTGDILGIIGEIRSDGGRLECVVDNSTEKVMDFWDDYALSFNRTSYSFLFDHLEKSQHDLTCTVLDQIISSGAGQSQGYTVKVFYLMVNPLYGVHFPLILR